VANAIHRFRDRDVKRVIRASLMAGITNADYEVDPNTGRIKIITKSDHPTLNPWEEAIADAKPPTEPAASTRRKPPRK
jgi:hypothetical protein